MIGAGAARWIIREWVTGHRWPRQGEKYPYLSNESKKICKRFVKPAYSQAFTAWFSDYERERLLQKKRKGASLANFKAPPASPESIAQVLDQVGIRNALQTLGVHRSTVARRILELEKEKAHLLKVGYFEAANDPLMRSG